MKYNRLKRLASILSLISQLSPSEKSYLIGLLKDLSDDVTKSDEPESTTA